MFYNIHKPCSLSESHLLHSGAVFAEVGRCCRGGQLLQRGAVVEAQRAGELYTETEIRVYLL